MKRRKEIKSIKLVILASCLCVFAGTCFYLQSCNLIDSDDDFEYKLEIPEEFNEVGKMHNEGLDYVFNAIKKMQLEKLKKKGNDLKSAENPDFYVITQTATLDFCKKKMIFKDISGEVPTLLFEPFLPLKSAKNNSQKLVTISSRQQAFFDDILVSMKQGYSRSNLLKVKEDLDHLNQRAIKELSIDEAKVIYCATSTAYATYQYWHKNVRKWYFAVNYPEILQKYNGDDLNHIQIKNGQLLLKSSDDEEDSWIGSMWTSVEEWWVDNWNDDEKNEWFEETLKEMEEKDIEGAIKGCKILSIPGAIYGGIINSADEGIDRLIDHYEDYNSK